MAIRLHNDVFFDYPASPLAVLSRDELFGILRRTNALLPEAGGVVCAIILLVTPPEKKALRPEHVDLHSGAVFCHGGCETPMRWLGFDDESGEHVFLCDLEHAEAFCPFAASCPRERLLPLDTGLFGPIPACVPGVDPFRDRRKLCERPFNLLKHVDGLEPGRLVRQSSVAAEVVFSQLVVEPRARFIRRGSRSPAPNLAVVVALRTPARTTAPLP